MVPQAIYFIILVLVTFVYAFFDVFNKRNVPDLFVYVTVLIGIGLTLTYDIKIVELSAALALVIGSFGYILFKNGMIGGGDVMEFVFVSLVLPIQPVPLFASLLQFNFPFILSILIASGYFATLYVPFYYLVIRRPKLFQRKEKPRIVRGLLLFVAYLALIFALKQIIKVDLLGLLLILLLAFTSSLIVTYEKEIYSGMISFILPKKLEDGDMVAVNLMNKKDIAYFKRMDRDFGRLITKKIILNVKSATRKIPVYRDSVPFALFIFVGVVISILFGNLVIYIVS